ncbi:hypothetical protein Dimus_035554, partial [Dionaea muscipula]
MVWRDPVSSTSSSSEKVYSADNPLIIPGQSQASNFFPLFFLDFFPINGGGKKSRPVSRKREEQRCGWDAKSRRNGVKEGVARQDSKNRLSKNRHDRELFSILRVWCMVVLSQWSDLS